MSLVGLECVMAVVSPGIHRNRVCPQQSLARKLTRKSSDTGQPQSEIGLFFRVLRCSFVDVPFGERRHADL
jgi:hypothetical protein